MTPLERFEEHQNGEYWFSSEKQKQHIFKIASELFVSDAGSSEPLDCLQDAESLVKAFYERHIQRSTRINLKDTTV